MTDSADLSHLIVDLDDIDPTTLLAGWESRLGGVWLPMLVTALGDAFVQSEATGEVCFLDAASATLEPVCDNADQLEELLENPEFVEHYFDPQAVRRLADAGLRRESDEVYVLRAGLADGGAWVVDNIVARPVASHFIPGDVAARRG